MPKKPEAVKQAHRWWLDDPQPEGRAELIELLLDAWHEGLPEAWQFIPVEIGKRFPEAFDAEAFVLVTLPAMERLVSAGRMSKAHRKVAAEGLVRVFLQGLTVQANWDRRAAKVASDVAHAKRAAAGTKARRDAEIRQQFADGVAAGMKRTNLYRILGRKHGVDPKTIQRAVSKQQQ